MTVTDKSIFKGLYGVYHRRVDEEKAKYYDLLMKLPEGISDREIAKVEKNILLCDRFQSFLYYRGMNQEIPEDVAEAYDHEIAKRDEIIGGYYY